MSTNGCFGIISINPGSLETSNCGPRPRRNALGLDFSCGSASDLDAVCRCQHYFYPTHLAFFFRASRRFCLASSHNVDDLGIDITRPPRTGSSSNREVRTHGTVLRGFARTRPRSATERCCSGASNPLRWQSRNDGKQQRRRQKPPPFSLTHHSQLTTKARAFMRPCREPWLRGSSRCQQ